MTRSRQASALALLVTALLLVLWLVPRTSFAQGPSTSGGSIGVSVDSRAPGDSARFRARWTPACDAGGCPDSVLITWILNGVAQPTRGLKARGDTVWTMRTVCPGVTTATASIVQMRRGRPTAAPLVRSATMGCREVAPPPPDSFAIDTGFVWRGAVRVDSARYPEHWLVTRADSSRVGVQMLGAQGIVIAQACADGVRWPADTAPLRLAQARAAQWPTDSLTRRARARFLAYDAQRWPAGAAWQQGCG